MNDRISVATIDSPEFINLSPMEISPLMSKCDIKVLYVGQNRNRSYITKQVATEMSKTLRGCPIVGQFIESKQDFGDHGDQVIIDGEGIKFNKLTKPYGFIAPDAKVWFQFFEDQDEFGNTCIREYLMTEGYLWTEQFKECQRVIENKNPQSMELDEESLNGNWSTDYNSGVDFFIINDAIFSKLCILGEDVEPCFEGSSFLSSNTNSSFTKNTNEFTKTLFSMMEELKYTLNKQEGGKVMHNLENANDSAEVNATVTTQFDADGGEAAADGSETVEGADTSDQGGDEQGSEEVPGPVTPDPLPPGIVDPEPSVNPDINNDAEDNVVLTETDKQIIDSLDDSYVPSVKEGEDAETITEALIKDGATNIPTKILQNSCAEDEDKKKYEKKDEEEDKTEKSDSDNSEDNTEGTDTDKKDNEDNDKDKKKKYALLEAEYEELKSNFSKLEKENQELLAFKENVETQEKQALIDSFYMLSDEDKKDVVNNIKTYSLKEIKAELSMICVDKKISFSDDKVSQTPGIYNLNCHEATSELPAWLKAVETYSNNK